MAVFALAYHSREIPHTHVDPLGIVIARPIHDKFSCVFNVPLFRLPEARKVLNVLHDMNGAPNPDIDWLKQES